MSLYLSCFCCLSALCGFAKILGIFLVKNSIIIFGAGLFVFFLTWDKWTVSQWLHKMVRKGKKLKELKCILSWRYLQNRPVLPKAGRKLLLSLGRKAGRSLWERRWECREVPALGRVGPAELHIRTAWPGPCAPSSPLPTARKAGGIPMESSGHHIGRGDKYIVFICMKT